MRGIFYATICSILFIAVPASACGGSGTGDGSQYCHDYTIHLGEGTTSAHANEKGQFLIGADTLLLGAHYVEQDIAYTDDSFHGPLSSDPWGFSIWWYQEANDRPGLQRADEVCNNTPEGEDSDVIIC